MFAPRLSPGQRLLGVFVLAVFVPGLLLAAFGARALWQERSQDRRQLQDRMDYAADSALRVLESELDRVHTQAKLSGWPNDSDWVYVENGIVTPHEAIPYLLHAPDRPVRTPDAILERAKIAETDLTPERVAGLYREMLATAPTSSLPEVRHRLALALRRSGRTAEAERRWREVEAEGGWIGTVPADLVAGFELSSVDAQAADAFYRNLRSGKWKLEKARYLYYSDEIRKRVPEDPVEKHRLQLGGAVEDFLAGSAPSGYFVLRAQTPSSALIASPSFLEARLSPQLATSADSELRVARVMADDQKLFGSETSETPRASRSTESGGLTWTLEVAPKDAAALEAASLRRSNLYLGMLLSVLAALGAGGYMAIRTVRRELEVARMKAEFVSTVSHEFRSPLTGIRQLGEMLARGRVSDEAKRKQYCDLIVRESERLGRLVENILDFSRMESGRKDYHVESIETSAWLRNVAEEFRSEASREGFRMETLIPDHLPRVAGDPQALATAVRNLLDNAVKYSPGGQAVWLEAEDAADGVRIRVRDHGVGIPERERSQIFEKFYRGEGELGKKVKGAGLGLSLVRHIVESHKGTVTVESRVGEGSTFCIHLTGAA